MVVDDERIRFDAPRTLVLKIAADEGEGREGQAPARYAATPLVLAQTLWSPGPPHVLAAYDPAMWTLFPGPILGTIARVDVRRLVQQLWPSAPFEDLAATMRYLGMVGMADRVPTPVPESALQTDVRRCMAVLATIYTVSGGMLTMLRDTALGEQPRWMGELLGPQAPDPVVQAMVDLTALPREAGAAALPDLWAADEVWADVPMQHLMWMAGDGMSRDMRDRADAGLGRRVREQGGTRQPGLILRRTGKLARI